MNFIYYTLRAEDTGTYTCIAENDAGRSSADIKLNVQGK